MSWKLGLICVVAGGSLAGGSVAHAQHTYETPQGSVDECGTAREIGGDLARAEERIPACLTSRPRSIALVLTIAAEAPRVRIAGPIDEAENACLVRQLERDLSLERKPQCRGELTLHVPAGPRATGTVQIATSPGRCTAEQAAQVTPRFEALNGPLNRCFAMHAPNMREGEIVVATSGGASMTRRAEHMPPIVRQCVVNTLMRVQYPEGVRCMMEVAVRYFPRGVRAPRRYPFPGEDANANANVDMSSMSSMSSSMAGAGVTFEDVNANGCGLFQAVAALGQAQRGSAECVAAGQRARVEMVIDNGRATTVNVTSGRGRACLRRLLRRQRYGAISNRCEISFSVSHR